MRLREPFQKKHVHTWRAIQQPTSPLYDTWGFEIDRSGDPLSRTCDECGCKQTAVRDPKVLDGLPASVWHLADLEWK